MNEASPIAAGGKGRGGPVFCKPFLTGLFLKIDFLEIHEDEVSTKIFDKPVIIERNGIHYINQDVLNADHSDIKDMNNDFKKLVDSIIG